MTPDQLLQSDAITVELMARGWTKADLRAARFSKWDPDLPFFMWAVEFPESKCPRDVGLLKAYLALRWLLIDNPPASANRVAASACVDEAKMLPLVEAGMSYGDGQRRRARKPRGRLEGDRRTLNQLIAELATKPHLRETRPAELWPHLIAELTGLELSPEELRMEFKLPARSIEYDVPEPRASADPPKRKTISYGRFRTVLSEARRAMRISRANE